MNKEEILAMSPDELDITMGEEIMGWHKRPRKEPLGQCTYGWWKSPHAKYIHICQCMFTPSRDIAEAWPIAIKMGLAVFPLNNKDWCCCQANYIYHIKIDQDHYADPELIICPTAPEAICKAAYWVKVR